MNVLYQCNDKYAPYCGVSLTSLFENNKGAENITVFILSEGISNENTKKFHILADKYNRSVEFINTEMLVQKMADMKIPTYRGSYSTNFKMFVSEYINKNVDKLLYIDSDTVVLDNISDLFNIDLQGNPLAMAQDSLVIEHKKDLGIRISEGYYNAGVILFDMNEWKKQQCSEQIAAHVQNVRASYPAPDQDLLNIVFRNNISELPPEYNMEPAYYMFSTKNYYNAFKNPSFYSKKTLEKAKENVKIIHFFRVMGEFPWHKDNMHPFNDLFDKYLTLSPWADYEKAPSGIAPVFKIEKLMYKYLPECIFVKLFHLSHIYFMKRSNKLSLKNEINKLM